MKDVTLILSQLEKGDCSSSEQLLPLVYDELRKLAAVRLIHERPDHTLQPTALVHEAYLRLVDVEKAQHWDSRGHFFSAAAEAMRRILIENARNKARYKHGGGFNRVDLSDSALVNCPSDELNALDDALTKFAKIEPTKAELVKLRYFAGLSIDDAADILQISRSTAKRYWTFARAWLLAELDEPGESKNS